MLGDLKTLGMSDGERISTISSAGLTQTRILTGRQTDRRTERHPATESTALMHSIAGVQKLQ